MLHRMFHRIVFDAASATPWDDIGCCPDEWWLFFQGMVIIVSTSDYIFNEWWFNIFTLFPLYPTT